MVSRMAGTLTLSHFRVNCSFQKICSRKTTIRNSGQRIDKRRQCAQSMTS